MADYGFSVAPSGSGASRDPGMTLQSKITQFKYNKVVFLDVPFPALTGVYPDNQSSQTINYFHSLGYKPSFMTYFHGHTWDSQDRWGTAYRGAQAVNAGARTEFPYSVFNEYCDSVKYSARILLYSGGPAIPAHTMTIRLTLLFDELTI